MIEAIMKIILLLFIAVTLSACDSGAKSKGAISEKPSCSIWNSDNCTCGAGKALVEDDNKKQCVDFKTQNFCLETKNGFQLALRQNDQKLFESCLRFESPDESKLGFERPVTVVAVDGMSDDDKKKLAVWADGHKEVLKSLKAWPSAAHITGATEILTTNMTSIKVYKDGILDPFLMPTRIADYLPSLPAVKVFQNVDRLIAFLENSKAKTAIEVEKFQFDEKAKILAEVYENGWSEDLAVVDSSSANKCSGSCIRQSAQKKGEYEILYREYVVENIVYRSELVLKDKFNNIVAQLYLAQNHFLFLNLFDRDGLGITSVVTIYDVHGQRVLSETPNGKDGATLLSQREPYLHKKKKLHYVVGLCESQIRVEDFAKHAIDDNLAFGPYSDNSYYGWVQEPINAKHFWMAREFFNLLDLPYDAQSYSEHAIAVARILTSDSTYQTGIVPLGVDECIKSAYLSTAIENAKASTNMRVVNVSMSSYQDKESCEEQLQNHPMIISEDTLWVVAAGNAGNLGAYGCPQHFSGRKNIIIVAASTNGYLDKMSNYGEDFADIATYGKDLEGIGWGTSFAAPRVSSVAAKIFFSYPKLTTEQVRLAILLGADFVSNTFQVRSRGELHEERAFDYAEKFNNKVDIKDAIREVECGFLSTCFEEKNKIKILEKLN